VLFHKRSLLAVCLAKAGRKAAQKQIMAMQKLFVL
jgi:hypothetical protein